MQGYKCLTKNHVAAQVLLGPPLQRINRVRVIDKELVIKGRQLYSLVFEGTMNRLDELLDDAINSADLERVKKLISEGANVEYRDSFGCTALMNAAWVASVEVVDYLLSLGVDVEARNNDGQTALEMVKTLGPNDYRHDEIIALLENRAR